jgi:glutamate synthase domain-containing protein 3
MSGHAGASTVDSAAEIDAADLEVREINARIRAAIDEGANAIRVLHAKGRHNLAVALAGDATITFDGNVGYFVGALGTGPSVEVFGNAGWSVGADVMAGGVHVHGNAGSSVAASIRGGRIVVDGDVGSRCAIALKGGEVIVGGSAGYMTGFMMQTGLLVIGGDAGDGLGDSMYTGDIFVGGAIKSLGADAVMREATDEEGARLRDVLAPLGHDPDRDWKHITSGGQLWHFEKEKFELWKEAF